MVHEFQLLCCILVLRHSMRLTFLLFGVAYLQLFLVSSRPIQVDLLSLPIYLFCLSTLFVLSYVVCVALCLCSSFLRIDRKIDLQTPFVYQLTHIIF